MPELGESHSENAGQIITFYSFKGGTGRSMTLANVAWILAANGKRVLVADWDLESPGLHRFFQPFLDLGVTERPGVIDFIRKYEWAAVSSDMPEVNELDQEAKKLAGRTLAKLIDNYTQIQDYAVPLSWKFPGPGELHFLSSGKQNGDYQTALSALDWDTFYDRLYGGQFFDALRLNMKRRYDYVLIDSRTGLSDVADICTMHLPDTLVDCFTLSTQGIEGAAMIAGLVRAHSERSIRVLPVPMRIDHAEQEKAETGQSLAMRLFEGLPAGMSDEQRREYWTQVGVPYRAFYSYEETLAVFGDPPGSPTSLLSSFERITAQVTRGAVDRLPPMEESLRLRTRLRFARRQPAEGEEVTLDFSPDDQLWAEWIAGVLTGAGVPVRWAHESPVAEPGRGSQSRVVAIVTEAYAARVGEPATHPRPSLAVCVTDSRLPHWLEDVPAIFLSGLVETRAADVLIERLGGRPTGAVGSLAVRYPGGSGAQILEIPARNANFTGRERDIRSLRDELRARGVAVVAPLTLRGLGGVGKTQVALEYAHRFQADYDLVWWLHCGQSQYVNASLADLGQRMRRVFQASVPEEGSVAEVAKAVLELLATWENRRWLLIYDNADDVDTILPLLASGPGHVLITSRSQAWEAHGRALSVDVFTRDESLQHLRQRIPSISEAEANKVAEVLGDLPLAVATAGAWLAETGNPVEEYLQRLEQQPARTLAASQADEDPVQVSKTWDVSLDQLQAASPAASRLFALCSVMAPDISLDLIYNKTMAAMLAPFERTFSDSMLMGKHIRQIDRFALIKLDTNAKQIQVHRLVQAVVRDRMSDEEIIDARRCVHEVLAASRPEGEVDDPDTWPRYRLIWPHLTPSRALRSEQEDVRQLHIERVRYLRLRGDLERGRRRADEIESAWEKMLSETTDPVLAESLRMHLFRLGFNKANIVRDLAEFTESKQLDEAVLNGQRELLGPEHPHTLMTGGSLAADLRALGQYHRALELDRGTYAAWQRGYGDDYPGTLRAAHNLAISLRLTGDFRAALAQDQLTLARRSTVLGLRHPRTLDSGAAVARDLLEAGRYQEAVSQISAVWVECAKALGDDDAATLNARVLLGVAQRSAGDSQAADLHIDEARKSLMRGFGNTSTNALAARLSHAVNLLARSMLRDAIGEAEGVLRVYEERLGGTHPHALICRLNIAAARCMQENYAPALVLAEEAAGGLAERLHDDHPYTLAAQMVVAAALAHLGRTADAARLEERITAEFDRVLGPQHPDTLRCRANMLLTLHEQGVDGALPERQQVIDMLVTLIGPDHPDVSALNAGSRLLRVIDPQPF